MLNIILNKYKNKIKIKQLKKLKFKTFKEVISLKAFKEHYIKDFYTKKELKKLRKFFNMNKITLNEALMKRSILNKIVVRKYNFLFYLKIFPNRFFKRKRKYFNRKKKKKKLNLRVKFFYRIAYDTFLFYLKLSNKELIIKPFNFFNALFFYKSKTFRKAYIIRKRRRMRFRFYYKFRRRKKRRSIRRRRVKFLKYKFKGKSLIKRFRQIKIRKYKNFLRFISFFNNCKKIKIKIDDYFKVNSILHLPYKLLKLNFNTITNSYNYFINFTNQQKKIIKIDIIKNIFNKERKKLYNIIKSKLKNRFILINKMNKLKNNQLPFYLFNNNIHTIKENIILTNKIGNLKKSDSLKKIINFLKLIKKISNHIFFIKKKINNFKNKFKKKIFYLFLKLLKINKKIIKKFKKYKKILNILLNIITKLKNKLKKLIINFYILFFNFVNVITEIKKQNKFKFLKKIIYFLNRKKTKNLNKKNNLFLYFFFKKNKFILHKNKKFIFSYKNKINNLYCKPWRYKKIRKKNITRKTHAFFKEIKRNFSLSTFFLYKNYFSQNNLLKNNNYYFGNKKFKFLYLNFLKKSNLLKLKNSQKYKNINFLNY